MKTLMVLFGGASSLFLGMGIARFAFTPVLPLMQADFAFTDKVSGAIASANYLGYLLGAFATRYTSGSKYTYRGFIISVPLSVIFIALMFFQYSPMWYFYRFASGFVSAVFFVHMAEIVMGYLARNDRKQYSGMIFSGLGAGIVFSGLAVPILAKNYTSSSIWLWLAAVSVIPGIIALLFVPKPERPLAAITSSTGRGDNRRLYLLYISYMLSGFGYIITGTFISVIVLRGTGSIMLSGYVWVMVGLGAVFITPLWSLLAKRIGTANALTGTFAVQAASIALPVVFPTLPFTLIGAAGYGGTFLGIVVLSLALGMEISPGKKTTSMLTLYFSIGQMAGPFMAGYMSDTSGGLGLPVLIAAVVMAAGGVLVFSIRKDDLSTNYRC